MAWPVTDAAKTATFDSTVLHRPRTARRRRPRVAAASHFAQRAEATGPRHRRGAATRARRGGQSDLRLPPARRTSCTLRHAERAMWGRMGQRGAEWGTERGREGRLLCSTERGRVCQGCGCVQGACRERAGCVQGACRERAGCEQGACSQASSGGGCAQSQRCVGWSMTRPRAARGSSPPATKAATRTPPSQSAYFPPRSG